MKLNGNLPTTLARVGRATIEGVNTIDKVRYIRDEVRAFERTNKKDFSWVSETFMGDTVYLEVMR
jgi:hypothetical protein